MELYTFKDDILINLLENEHVNGLMTDWGNSHEEDVVIRDKTERIEERIEG